MSSPPAAPFPRALYGPDDARHSTPGDDVVAVKRGLWRADLFAGPASSFDREYNRKAVAAVRELQKHAGIQATGNYGLASHEALRRMQPLSHPGEWAFDATALDLLKAEAKLLAVTPEQRAKHAGVDAANFWILHRDESDYAQVRPFPIIKPPKIARRVDCSGFVTEVYYAAGAPDPNGRGYDGEGYCHEPSARVLTRDLRWIPAGDLSVGDELWALDQEPEPSGLPDRFAAGRGRAGRRFRRATVIASFLSKKETVRVCLETGETFICSADHPWLTQTAGTHAHKWLRADQLLSPQLAVAGGTRSLVRPFVPWEPATSYEAGWLAGMFDGEGWVVNRGARGGRTNGVGITQAVGPTADRLVRLARKYGDFRVATVERPGIQTRLDVTTNGGGMPHAAEFLGRVRPERLIENFNIEGGHVFGRNLAAVVAVERVGVREVQSIQTTMGTYLAEGFAVHNTGTLVGHGRQVDVHAVDLLDLVFYGFTTRPSPAFPYGSPTHVTVYIGGGYVASDGSQSGPEKREVWYRGSAASGSAPSGLHSVRRYPLV